MADNNNKEYSTGGSNSFDLFSDFDSAASASTVKAETKSEPVQQKNSEIPSSSADEVKTDSPKKNPLFAVICAVLCVAIAVCGCLSVLNISKLGKNSGGSDVGENGGYNVYSEMIAKYNPTKYPAGIQQSLAKAYAANNDLVGWIYIPGTAVDFPVVQAKDNNEYLTDNFYGNNMIYGMTFADYRCKKSELSSNLVIYDHDMVVGTHFYDVARYDDIEWYRKHPVIRYSTLYGDYTYLVYATFYTTAQVKYNGGYFFNYIYPNMGPVSLKGYIREVDDRAIYKTGISADYTDKFITLSTCSYALDRELGMNIDARVVVVGRLLRDDESEEVDVSKAKSNPDYRRPQIWYDKKGKKNPYAKSVTWVPSEK